MSVPYKLYTWICPEKDNLKFGYSEYVLIIVLMLQAKENKK